MNENHQTHRALAVHSPMWVFCLTCLALLAPAAFAQPAAKPGPPLVSRSGALTAEEQKMAAIAWKYFENNTQPETGLVNAVDKYPSTTMWDAASYLGGLVAALELGIISRNDFDRRMTAQLRTFNALDFFRDELPNKVYNTKTAQKVDYANKPGEIGFSALDLGRLLIWLKIIKERYPSHSNGIDSFIMRWKFCNVVDTCGSMYGAVLEKGQPRYLQEGRLGYEEYSAKGFQLWGFSTVQASRPEPYSVVQILGIDVPYDTRDPRELGAHNYVVSESYILDGIEFDWDLVADRDPESHPHSDALTAEFARRIYQVQKNRYNASGRLTARSEHQLAVAPYFVYDTIYSDGYPWNTITDEGKFAPAHAAVSLKAGIGMWVLWKDDYTDVLYQSIANLYDPERGFYEGLYENGSGLINTFTANTNGIILEELLYKAQGKLLRFSDRPNMWDAALRDEFQGKERCLPQHRPVCPSAKPGH